MPSDEGPYFIVGLLDFLVYRIKMGPRSKFKVVHHPRTMAGSPKRLTPGHPLCWISAHRPQTSVPSICGTFHQTQMILLWRPPRLSVLHFQLSRATILNWMVLGLSIPVNGQASCPPLNSTPLQRNQRIRTALDIFGDWVSHCA